jgi:hypothetical protein
MVSGRYQAPKVTFFELSADDPPEDDELLRKGLWLAVPGVGRGRVLAGDDRSPGGPGHQWGRPAQEAEERPGGQYLGVANLDEAIKKIEKNGGKVAVPKMDIPNLGTMVYFLDTEGNVHGLIQPRPNPMMEIGRISSRSVRTL